MGPSTFALVLCEARVIAVFAMAHTEWFLPHAALFSHPSGRNKEGLKPCMSYRYDVTVINTALMRALFTWGDLISDLKFSTFPTASSCDHVLHVFSNHGLGSSEWFPWWHQMCFLEVVFHCFLSTSTGSFHFVTVKSCDWTLQSTVSLSSRQHKIP